MERVKRGFGGYPHMIGRRPAVASQGCRQDAIAQGLSLLRRSWARLVFGVLLGLILGVGSTFWATAQQLPTGQQLIPNPQQFRALEQPSSALSALRAEQLAAEANAAIQAQNYDQAVELLQQVFNAYRGQALAYRDMQRFDEALEAVDRAIAASCSNPELYYLKAQILVSKGQDREAVPLFDQALQASAQLPQPLVEQIQMERDRAAQRSGLTGQLPATPSP